MKKLFSFMMALVLLFSLGITAFAAENNGSITITNATIGDTYQLYKIFDASYSVDENDKKAVSYSIDKPTAETDATSKHIFETLFGTDGTKSNDYFIYNPDTGEVKSNGSIDKITLSTYMNELVSGQTPLKTSDPATSTVVKFENLEHGYYVIDKPGDAGTTVTITSAAPTIEVIDKNQLPGKEFTKSVKDEDTNEWLVNSSANIGDIVDFKVEFTATNYNQDKLIKHYTIKDHKGNALWVEFNSIEVRVNGESVGKGWYHCANNDPDLNLDTGDWTAEKKPNQWAATANEADWYLIHYGYDDFDIVIPWLENHQFVATGVEYELKYPEEPTSKNPSPAKVEILYNASVEPGANIVGESNLFNQAELSWTDETTTTHPDKPRTDLTVHALGITKIDGETSELLPEAVFKLYSDSSCTTPIYVIPTDVDGVYILDDLNTIVSGDNRETSRKKYESKLAAYLGADYVEKKTQKNEVVTQSNGKLVVLGLEKGTYWLRETDAPDGYNVLSAATSITIDGSTEDYIFNTDDAGKVVTENATKTHTYKVKGQIVENNKGVELPSTGGKGTMMMITIGTMIAMAFAVLLITHKKMSIYQD